MNKVLNNYIIKNYLKIILNWTLIFTCVVILLNLFQEIEFFKDLNVGFEKPLILTLMFAPNIVIKMFPFIIFLSTMYYLVSINNNKELITFKIFGFSNIKLISILSLTTFFIGLIILLTINPITSSMVKYYEQVKSQYSEDVDHLVSINKNGVWIKEKSENEIKMIYAKKLQNEFLYKLSIYYFDKTDQNLIRIEAEKGDISENNWLLHNVNIFDTRLKDKVTHEKLDFYSIFNLNKIKSAYKNLDTISFINLLRNQNEILNDGYSEEMIKEKLNSHFTLPIFLVLMVFLASIFGLETKNKINNTYYIFVSIIACVLVYYFKDLSIALGQTNKISVVLSVWMPLIAVTLFCSIGLLRLYEK
tara:strand:- start:1837 stop:2919 length:1083 start_codon:yes stop_codon:yes gene_type:complete